MKQSELLELMVRSEFLKKELKSINNQIETELENLPVGPYKGFNIIEKQTTGFSWRKYLDFIKPRLKPSDILAEADFTSNNTKKSFEIK